MSSPLRHRKEIKACRSNSVPSSQRKDQPARQPAPLHHRNESMAQVQPPAGRKKPSCVRTSHERERESDPHERKQTLTSITVPYVCGHRLRQNLARCQNFSLDVSHLSLVSSATETRCSPCPSSLLNLRRLPAEGSKCMSSFWRRNPIVAFSRQTRGSTIITLGRGALRTVIGQGGYAQCIRGGGAPVG